MKKKISFISGNFNIIHAGHIRLFKYAKNISDKLIVGLNSDNYASEKAYIDQENRLDALLQISLIDECVIVENLGGSILKIKPDFIIKGLEFKDTNNEENNFLIKSKSKLIFSSGEVSYSSEKLFKETIPKNTKNNKIQDYLRRHNITSDKTQNIIKNFKKLKVLVIGEIITDIYMNHTPLGLSKESNSLVYKEEETKVFLGGAGIVAAHGSALGSKTHLISLTGDIDNKNFIKNKLKEYKVSSKLFYDDNFKGISKKRFLNDNNNLFRSNKFNRFPIGESLRKNILNYIKKIINKFDIVIFSDFNYGLIDDILVKEVQKIIGNKKITLAADSQVSSQTGDILKYNNFDIITPTEHEVRTSILDNNSGLVILLEKLRNLNHSKNIIMTQGKLGMFIHSYHNKKKLHVNDTLEPFSRNVVDASGAGDSLLISSVLSYHSSKDIWLSAYIGNLASSIQISRMGNVPIKLDELINLI